MIPSFADPFETLFALQRALDSRLASDWIGRGTAAMGSYPPINVFQQKDDFVAVIELPGINKDDLQLEAKENTIRISGKKTVGYQDGASVHRRERVRGEFDRTLSLRYLAAAVDREPLIRQPPFFASHACMKVISFSCAAMTPSARARISGSFPYSSSTFAMSIAP